MPTSYDEALKHAKADGDIVVLLLNRCYARLQSEHYDDALADATAVIDMSVNRPSEKALFRAARALYGLRRWKDSLGHLNRLLQINPKNADARKNVMRCERRLKEDSGQYDFKDMLEEAGTKAPAADMDRADYTGPVEVRRCKIPSHGRGMFTTRAVKAGDLLLCEKAFAAVFADPDQDVKTSKEKTEEESQSDRLWLSLDQRDRLITKCLVKLHKNPSLKSGFGSLYPGPHWTDKYEKTKKTKVPILNESVYP